MGRVITTPWSDGSRTYHGHELMRYEVTTVHGHSQWLSDYSNSQPGYFITGNSESRSLWSVFRLEPDAFDRCLFTIAPIQYTPRLPLADFSRLGAIAPELDSQYKELAVSATHGSYRDVVTKARSIIEAILAITFKVEGRDRLNDSLQKMKALLEKEGEACGYTFLEYHIAQKVRLAHARTHVTMGRPLTPEFAVGVADDLAFLLREWGYASNRLPQRLESRLRRAQTAPPALPIGDTTSV